MSLDPIGGALSKIGVELPSEPCDLSHVLKAAGVTRCYAILMIGRTGSTWLASALEQVPGAGHPQEYFSDEGLLTFGRGLDGRSLPEFFLNLVEKYREGEVFGFKIDPDRLLWLSKYVDVRRTFNLDNSFWIDMRRWNIVHQAFSFVRAKKTGVWHDFGVTANGAQNTTFIEGADLKIADTEIFRFIKHIIRAERDADAFFAASDIIPPEIFYEEIYDDKIGLVLRILHKIDANRNWPKLGARIGKTKKLANDDNLLEMELFVRRNIGVVSQVMDARKTITLGEFDALTVT